MIAYVYRYEAENVSFDDLNGLNRKLAEHASISWVQNEGTTAALPGRDSIPSNQRNEPFVHSISKPQCRRSQRLLQAG